MGAGAGFDDFFRAEYPRLVGLARAMTGDHELACDLAQETLLRCHRSWARVEHLEIPGAWARRVLLNLVTDHRRAAGRRDRARPRPPEPVDTLGDPVIDGWWDAVRALPDRQRTVVALHYLEDRSVADIAAVLGLSVGSVKASLFKARQSLIESLREGFADELDR